MNKLSLLSQINLFEELPMDELKVIDKMSDMYPMKKGTIVLNPLKPMHALFLLKKGTVRLYRSNEEGKQLTVDLLGDGNVFGETSTFSLHDDDVYAEALTDVYICIIGKEEMESLMKKSPTLAIKFIEILSARLREMYELSEQIALRSVRYRMLALLLKLSERFGKRTNQWQTIDIKITHHDLATMIGSTRETVSATLSQLKKEKIVQKTLFSLKIDVEKAGEELKGSIG
ncbi:CRP/FNR family transcriptional regulator [Scopulibacillus darangshiensis]|uniref:CRP/FNR family transcriptional regulator n=1 Tax=Scopulibacillus darangshiensis TaxID=442528 RepID=A0A4R2P7G9_9BACL|nr:Crp/Fnr family transcriptional regulator [Scopulibacillus darangshiensis]TCP29931.1 CRP/FNR family transcriptional regulator [Scopulibacillus darangshiensis]